MKEKPNSIRTYDAEGFRRRASCLCFRDKTEQEILLVTSSKDREKYVVPGGGIEPQEEAKATAEREALEEAGVRGDLGRFIGTFEESFQVSKRNPNKEKKHRTKVFAFIVTEYLDDWDDKRSMGRSRQWFSFEEAKKRLTHKPIQVTYLERLDKPERIT
ncbi:diphosphoinositol polyphosphate phosphohydrolase 3-alpha-like isoform X1 [Mytilus galloprovincialis]|uniref:diphosphoinositol polyphosphate phosphohydrolase 3-alpha-like isoform X1 n=1 Tax=Mytilus galloprovincialis TaxID=29158 RepID=UPI003F7CA20B